ncbi:MAG TPA: hypothetical protein VE596_00070, partial [Gaiellaceae bacterium]|nr:hypothetical protein [Gaiellaceae bacterium]
MSSSPGQRRETAGSSSENLILWLILAVGFVAGIALLLGAILWEEHSDSVLGPDLIRDLGIGALVSVFVTILIESYAGRMLRRKIASDVLEAAFEKVVPAAVFQEVTDNVFYTSVFRRKWEVDLEALDRGRHSDLYRHVATYAKDIVILDYRARYTLENLYNKQTSFDVTGGIDLDVPLPDLGVPRFKEIRVRTVGKQTELVEEVLDEEDAKRVLTAPKGITVGPLKIWADGKQLRFMLKREFDVRGTVEVEYRIRRGIHVPGAFVLSTPVPADGARISASGRDLEFELNALHPDNGALTPTGAGQWDFSRV